MKLGRWSEQADLDGSFLLYFRAHVAGAYTVSLMADGQPVAAVPDPDSPAAAVVRFVQCTPSEVNAAVMVQA